LSVKGIEFDRERGFAMQIYEAKPNDFFRKVANANPQSFANAVVNVAAIGISLNPAIEARLPRPAQGAICLDISYMGLMHIAQDCGAIQWGQAVIVRERGQVRAQRHRQQPKHVYKPFATEAARGRSSACTSW
jgi:recombination protein RecT